MNAINEKTIDERIQDLHPSEAVFCLRALLLAGHVSEYAMAQTITLASTIKKV